MNLCPLTGKNRQQRSFTQSQNHRPLSEPSHCRSTIFDFIPQATHIIHIDFLCRKSPNYLVPGKSPSGRNTTRRSHVSHKSWLRKAHCILASQQRIPVCWLMPEQLAQESQMKPQQRLEVRLGHLMQQRGRKRSLQRILETSCRYLSAFIETAVLQSSQQTCTSANPR